MKKKIFSFGVVLTMSIPVVAISCGQKSSNDQKPKFEKHDSDFTPNQNVNFKPQENPTATILDTTPKTPDTTHQTQEEVVPNNHNTSPALPEVPPFGFIKLDIDSFDNSEMAIEHAGGHSFDEMLQIEYKMAGDFYASTVNYLNSNKDKDISILIHSPNGSKEYIRYDHVKASDANPISLHNDQSSVYIIDFLENFEHHTISIQEWNSVTNTLIPTKVF